MIERYSETLGKNYKNLDSEQVAARVLEKLSDWFIKHDRIDGMVDRITSGGAVIITLQPGYEDKSVSVCVTLADLDDYVEKSADGNIALMIGCKNEVGQYYVTYIDR